MALAVMAVAGIVCGILSGTAYGKDEAIQEKAHADLIVAGRYVVTMDDTRPLIENGAVAILGDSIVAVGPREEIEAGYTAPQTIEGTNRVLMPGLVNGHTHAAMVLFRGMADDLPLMTWLEDYIFPMEARHVDADFIAAGTALACYEMIRGGTTSFVDMYFYPDVIAETVVECGLRAVVGAPLVDFPFPGSSDWEDGYAKALAFIKHWKGRHDRITPALAPHAPYTVSEAHLQESFAAARTLDVPIMIHLAEAESERDMTREKYRKTPVELLADMGMLTQTTLAAHVVWPTQGDIELLAHSAVGVIHNPTSNLKLGVGIAPVPAMLSAGVRVGLGTDGAGSNNDLDLWEEMRLAALIHKGVAQDSTVVPAQAALYMATRGGALAAGLPETGALKPGLKADMIQVALDRAHLTPLYNVASQLVYAANSGDVVTSIVAGRVLMRDREVLSLNFAELERKAILPVDRIRADLDAAANN